MKKIIEEYYINNTECKYYECDCCKTRIGKIEVIKNGDSETINDTTVGWKICPYCGSEL